jgi:hypothetical protein
MREMPGEEPPPREFSRDFSLGDDGLEHKRSLFSTTSLSRLSIGWSLTYSILFLIGSIVPIVEVSTSVAVKVVSIVRIQPANIVDRTSFPSCHEIYWSNTRQFAFAHMRDVLPAYDRVTVRGSGLRELTQGVDSVTIALPFGGKSIEGHVPFCKLQDTAVILVSANRGLTTDPVFPGANLTLTATVRRTNLLKLMCNEVLRVGR